MPYKFLAATSLAAALLCHSALAASALPPAAQAQMNEIASVVFKGQSMPPDLQALCAQELRRAAKQKVLNFDAFEQFDVFCLTPRTAHEPRNFTYLKGRELTNPDIAANLKATLEVMSYITFAIKNDNGDFIGYWQWPRGTPISEARIVSYYSEGQFELMRGRTITETLLLDWADPYNEGNAAKKYQRARKSLEQMGAGPIPATYKQLEDQLLKRVQMSPDQLHTELYRRYTQEALGKK